MLIDLKLLARVLLQNLSSNHPQDKVTLAPSQCYLKTAVRVLVGWFFRQTRSKSQWDKIPSSHVASGRKK